MANMIEEKKLKKTFILATVVSTLIGTFSAAIALTDKIQEKRDKAKQNKVDNGQDQAIQDINKKLTKFSEGGGNGQSKGTSDESSDETSRSRLARRRRRDDDDFNHSARRSRALIEDVYEDNLRRIGPRYAVGDAVTENKLQAQIITLQQTVITVLQDALLNNRNLTASDTQKLLNAQQVARIHTLDALQDQYDRQFQGCRKSLNPSVQPRLLLEVSPLRRQQTHLVQPPSLFCPYSIHLQHSTRPLSNAFAPHASQRCPDCTSSVLVDTRDVWVFSTSTTPPAPARDFQMDARFVVKCHTPDGRLACVLCERFADMDCLCTSVDALVRHMGHAHSADEFASDVDLLELSASGAGVRKAVTW